MSNIQDFTGYNPTWCPGCGDWGIGMGIKSALVKLNLDPSGVAAVFDIGCSGNMNDFLNAYACHGLHGRCIPTAIGIKLANHTLPVIAIGGDGGVYGEGGNHFIHACRGNHDITAIVHDNRVYGLTTGQVAPTARQGYKSKSTPFGIVEVELNPLAMALVSGATFIAQGFAGDLTNLIELIKAGIEHKGFSLINILQPCVTFNKINTYEYYLKRAYKLGDDYDKADFDLALEKSLDPNQEKFPLGILYQDKRSSFHESLPQLENGIPLLKKTKFENLGVLLEDFT